MTATVVAVSVTGALAAAARAEPAPASADGVAIVTTPAASPRLAPVTEHPVDPAVLAAVAAHPGDGGGQTATETIQLTIVGGDLELETDRASVTLHPVDGSDRDWTGTLPPVRVVDARGTHEGWRVVWTVASLDLEGRVPAAKVRVEPGSPTVVEGLPDGLTAGIAGSGVGHRRALFGAEPGYGGGTYEAGGTVSLRLPPSMAGAAITVELSFSLD